eukprot:Skav206044  [mRNA]  locus=scaffold587:61891:71919:- [translate_table: standard]
MLTDVRVLDQHIDTMSRLNACGEIVFLQQLKDIRPFLIRCHAAHRYEGWLYSLEDLPVDGARFRSEGARAWAALKELNLEELRGLEAGKLEAVLEASEAACPGDSSPRRHCVAVARAAVAAVSGLGSLDRSPGPEKSDLIDLDLGIAEYFEQDEASEIIEMVDAEGNLLSEVPRQLVHQHNLLHRGVGLFVTRAAPIEATTELPSPEIYVARPAAPGFTDEAVARESFPRFMCLNCKDMFVGGLSTAGEAPELTAAREVREELGLGSGRLSELLRCVVAGLQRGVCTAYNRCVVDLFSYTADPAEEIAWQEEEVSWGAFVPYAAWCIGGGCWP